MASLTGTQVKHTYDSLLKLEDNDGLNSGLKKVTDGLGTQSPLSLSEIEVVSSVNVEASGFQTPTGTSDQLLVANGTTTSASALSGANINGTTNYVAKFDSASSVSDSLIYDNGTQVLIGATSSVFSDDLYLHNTSAYAVSGWRVGTTTTYVGKLFNNSGVLSLQSDGVRSIGFGNATNGDIVRIDGVNSRVGIGTTSPLSALHVVGTSRADQITLTSKGFIGTNATGINIQSVNGDIEINPFGNTTITNGNVGIGITSPATKLDVKGPTSGYIARFRGTSNLSVYDAGGSAIGVGAEAGSQLKLFSNNSFNNGITVDTNGNIGIGTTSPAHRVTSKLTTDNNYAFYAVNAAGGNRGGIYITSAGDTQFVGRTAAGQTVAINANSNSYFNGGNVGIGTTSPAYKLDVAGNIRGTAYRIDSATVLSGSTSVFLGSSGSTGTVSLTTTAGQGLVLNGGNVGIGTTSPLSKLHINDGTNVNLKVGNVGGELQIKTTNDADTAYSPMVLRASEYNILSGDVGIGTTSPDEKLHVSGNAKVTNLYVLDSIIHDGDADTLVSFSTDEVGVSAGGIKQLTVTSDNVNITDTLSYNYPSATGQYNGEIVSFGTFYTTNGTIAAGDVIVYTQAGINTGWFKASATTTYGKGMFGIAMGTTAADGILVKGFASNAAYTPATSGTPVYISTTAGTITSTAPSTTGDVVRLVGYMLDAANDEIYFSPDESWTIA